MTMVNTLSKTPRGFKNNEGESVEGDVTTTKGKRQDFFKRDKGSMSIETGKPIQVSIESI